MICIFTVTFYRAFKPFINKIISRFITDENLCHPHKILYSCRKLKLWNGFANVHVLSHWSKVSASSGFTAVDSTAPGEKAPELKCHTCLSHTVIMLCANASSAKTRSFSSICSVTVSGCGLEHWLNGRHLNMCRNPIFRNPINVAGSFRLWPACHKRTATFPLNNRCLSEHM